jgi:hypothetical protein
MHVLRWCRAEKELGDRYAAKQANRDRRAQSPGAQLADEASRVLPDPVDVDQLQAWGMQHGISPSEIMSELGGSP